jgi:hypothetical protein
MRDDSTPDHLAAPVLSRDVSATELSLDPDTTR